ncbi:Peptidoglycan L-alanyl-D-glutamate endopeptidase CwlK precursor [compost metagenome]
MSLTDRSLSSLQPTFKAKVERWLNDVKAESNSRSGALSGIDFVILEMLRTFTRSNELYAQGRTKPGPIVTKAKAGQSYHNFGLAVDGGPKYRDKAFTWAWDKDSKLMAAMKRVAALAKRHGIEWGGEWTSFRDLPHFQDAEAPPLAICRQRWPKGWQGVSR